MVQMTRTEIADEIAHKFLEGMSTQDLERFFYDHHFEYYTKTASDNELKEMAEYVGLVELVDDLTIVEEN